MSASRLFTLAFVLCLASGCAEPKPVDEGGSPTSDAHERAQEDSTSECVKACTDERRAEAIGWEAIVASCEASCGGR